MKRELKTMDGNTAAGHVAYAFSEVAAIYPITPSSPMAENIDIWASEDRKNIFGEKVNVVEMQSEGGAAGAVHGAVMTGAYTSTFTASQGLLLMIPNMYKLAAEQNPCVIHVAARALSTHALSIFGDHSDVMACRQTGFAMLASNNPQEVMDLAAVAHLAAIRSKVPMMHFFDGFRTSHEQQKIQVWDYNELKQMVDWKEVTNFRKRAINPMHPHSMGSAEQPETFFQHREACNQYYDQAADIIVEEMEAVNKKLGTNYKPFNYYGAKDAEEIIIAMGSVCDATEEVVDYLTGMGKKVGVVKVHMFRPFSAGHLEASIPKTVKKIAVLDRTKEPGSQGEPLYLDVVAALKDTKLDYCKIFGGRYGLGSKDTQPGDIMAVYENLWEENPKNGFTLSITDDVTGLSLPKAEIPDITPEGTISCKFWGLGADGTVGANKNSIKIIGDHTDYKVQAYFQYDSKKSGGITISHIRFGQEAIKSTYYVKRADFVACHSPGYMGRYKIVQDIKPGGFFLLNCPWCEEEVEAHIPGDAKRYMAENNVQFYICDASGIAEEIGLGARRTNTILQAAFFKLSKIIPAQAAVKYMKEAIEKTYGAKGDKIVAMNCEAVDMGIRKVYKYEIPESWKNAETSAGLNPLKGRDEKQTYYVNDILRPSNAMEGDHIPVSKFVPLADGAIPSGTAAFEKRGIAVNVPVWDPKKCMQCNWCSFVCPHGVIRPYALTEEDVAKTGAACAPMRGVKDRKYIMAVSALDCTGCGCCAEICPARQKAIDMVPINEKSIEAAQTVFDYANAHVQNNNLPFNDETVKGTQFKKPLLEFSGACPGCGESPYAKLITQLFGERMFIANATGCSSIWACSAPSTPYTVNEKGRGPAWATSLFEDNAEFGLGMAISMKTRRNQMKTVVQRLSEQPFYEYTAKAWINGMDDVKTAEEAGSALEVICNNHLDDPDAKYVVDSRDMLPKPSMWIFGGDGWAYDIGYGGLDHVIATGENVNILVFDTEVYSNTGGQASKSTPTGAVAQFASNGKSRRKKNLAQIAISYGYVYVAQIALGSDPKQALDAIKEAEAYNGPSLIIAYAPCINHGVKAGMNRSMNEMRRAVRSGYWNLFRYNPDKIANKQNPLTLDSPAPSEDYIDFLMGEVRYNSLAIKFPERAELLFSQAQHIAQERYDALLKQHENLEPGKEGEA